MKKLSILKLAFLFAASLSLSTAAISQTAYQSKTFDIKLNGTSNVHDWEMKAVKGNSEVSFTINGNSQVTSLSKLSFTLPATNLKSGHSGMDNNTYKALNTASNPNISFASSSATITATTANNYQINCKGKLTIAGKTNAIDLVATGKYNPSDKSFTVTGIEKMKMTDYNVEPPKALLGTIKTGNDISISYNLKYTK